MAELTPLEDIEQVYLIMWPVNMSPLSYVKKVFIWNGLILAGAHLTVPYTPSLLASVHAPPHGEDVFQLRESTKPSSTFTADQTHVLHLDTP